MPLNLSDKIKYIEAIILVKNENIESNENEVKKNSKWLFSKSCKISWNYRILV